MPTSNRRAFILSATALGATAVWVRAVAIASPQAWRERRDLFTDGVASGDPDSSSVILWTRRRLWWMDEPNLCLNVEVAEDEGFNRVVAHARSAIFFCVGLDQPCPGRRSECPTPFTGIASSIRKAMAAVLAAQSRRPRSTMKERCALLSFRARGE